MPEAIKISQDKQRKVPDTPEKRIADLMKEPLSRKRSFVPPVGGEFNIGPFVYRITVTNPSQLRFTATLKDVIITGVNDGSTGILDMNGKEIIKG